jgi:hypothetical protein
MSYQTRVVYTATSGQREFDLTFPYLRPEHVKCLVRGVPSPFVWITASRIRTLTIPGEGARVQLYRQTPVDAPLVQYEDGANLTADDLNTAVLQLTYAQQELTDLYNGALKDAQVRLGDNLGVITDPATVADQLVLEILDSDLFADLQDKLTDAEALASTMIEQTLRVDGLRTEVDALIAAAGEGDAAALILEEQEARIEADTSIVNTLALLGAKNLAGTAFILDTATVKVSPTETLATRLSALSAADGDNAASILTEQTARIDGDEALAESITELTAEVGDVAASVETEATARAAGDTALAGTLSLIGAKNLAGTAFILDTSTVRVSPTETLAERFTALDAGGGEAGAAIAAETTARVNGDNALATQIETVQSNVDDVAASVVDEATARTDADEALASDIESVLVVASDAAAAVVDEALARADGDNALATSLSALTSTVAGNTAAISTEASTRASADSALSSSISALTSTVAGNTAAISSEASTRAAADSALSSSISALTATVSGNTAAITAEATARAAADSTFTSQISTLTSDYGGLSATVSTQASTLSGISGALSASWGVTVDVNGRVAGLKLQTVGGAGTTTSYFDVTADKFRVFNGTSDTPVFEVSGGNLYVSGQKVRTESIVANAVSNLQAQVNDSIVQIPFWTSTQDEFAELDAFTFESSGIGEVMIQWSGIIQWNRNGANLAEISLTNGPEPTVVNIPGVGYVKYGAVARASARGNGNSQANTITLTHVGTYPAGTHTVKVWGQSDTNTSSLPVSDAGKSFLVMEMKR